MRTVRLALFAAAVLLAPAAASAEPINFTSQFQYSSTPDAAGGASFSITPTTNLPKSIDPVTDPTATYATIKFAPQTATAVDATEAMRTTSFWVALNLTDTASGQSGTLQVSGVATSSVPGVAVPVAETTTTKSPEAGIAFDNGTSFADLTLGANTYRFQTTLNAPGADGSITGTVTLSLAPNVSNTPEPGTLALAAIGFAPALGLWARRRKA